MTNFILDILFPKRCVGCSKIGAYLCSNCMVSISEHNLKRCLVCYRKSEMGETHLSCNTKSQIDGLVVGVEEKGIVKKLFRRFTQAPYQADLKNIIGKIFYEMISQNELFMRTLPQQPIVMVFPSLLQNSKKIGYNPSEMLATYIATQYKLQISSKNPEDKKVKYSSINGKTVLLIGCKAATPYKDLKDMARMLKVNGAKKVYGVVFVGK